MTLARLETAVGESHDRVGLREELEVWKDTGELAKAIANTDFVPRSLRGNPPAVLACMLRGHELGISPLHALSQIHVIEGRPGLASELMRALVLAAGHRVWTEDFTQTRVTLCGSRAGEDVVQRVTWSLDDARRAGLAGKDNWRRYPRAMLLARATGELCRLLFADVLAGMGHTVEELQDLAEETPAGELPAPAPRTKRKASGATAKRGARKAAAIQADETSPLPPAPPLPGEPGYDDLGAQTAGDASSGPAGAHASAGPSAASGPPAGPPPEEQTGTHGAQAIAMRARRADIDHHQIVEAVTDGRTTSAKNVTTVEAQQILEAIDEIAADRAHLDESEGRWRVVTADDAGEEPPWETYQADYGRLLQTLRSLPTAKAAEFKAWRIAQHYPIPPETVEQCEAMQQHANQLAEDTP